jgi:hypothetical protein
MASNRSDNSNTTNNKAKASGDRSANVEPRAGESRAGGNRQSGNTGPNRAAVDPNEQSARVRDDGRRDTDLDDDRTDQRMAAKRDANRQAQEVASQRDAGQIEQGGERIEQGSHARDGMGAKRQTDGT